MSHPKDSDSECGVNELAHGKGQVPKRRHSIVCYAVTTEPLQRSTCAKLKCRRRLSSFLPNPLISFNVSRASNEMNEGITSKTKHEQQVNNGKFRESPLVEPMCGLMMVTCFNWPTSSGDVVCYLVKIHGNYRSCIYSAATVMQREREAFPCGCLDEYGGWRTRCHFCDSWLFSPSRVTVMKYNRTSIWHRMTSDVGD